MRQEPVADISHLSSSGFGPRTVTWWGTMGFMALEGTGFLLAAGALLYLYSLNQTWPLSARYPDPIPGTIVTLILLVSLIPNHLLNRWAYNKDLFMVQTG